MVELTVFILTEGYLLEERSICFHNVSAAFRCSIADGYSAIRSRFQN